MYASDPVEIVVPPPEPQGTTGRGPKPLPYYKTHAERVRTWAAILSCIASIINMGAVLFLMFAYYHVL
jgi:hypothetical protein